MDVIFSLDSIASAAQQVLDILKGRKVVAFKGAMGSGKTTFIHAICDRLQVTDTVSSPSFPIINEYRSAHGYIIYHLDLYRLKDEAEAVQAGVEDCLFSGNLCLVEWPEKAAGLFPSDTVYASMETLDISTRKLEFNL